MIANGELTAWAKDAAKVWLINGATFGVVTLSDVEMILKIILLCVSIGYTAWRWVRDNKKGGHDDAS